MGSLKDVLTDSDVEQICQLIDKLEQSALGYLQIDSGEFKVTISKTEGAAITPYQGVAVVAGDPGASENKTIRSDIRTTEVFHEKTIQESSSEGLITVTAPIMGRFYSKPEPGADAFVNIGFEVSEDTPICLIEVMKMFNTVPAGVSGFIEKICVEDGDFVEYGAPLFIVRVK